MSPKDTDGMANSIVPDQTAASLGALIWVYIVYSDLSVGKLRIIMVGLLLFLARLYKSTGRAIVVTTVVALASASMSTSTSALLKMLKFLVKVFKSLYLLNPWMDLADTLPDVRYWSEVLCCTSTTHISDLEVKVTDFEI